MELACQLDEHCQGDMLVDKSLGRMAIRLLSKRLEVEAGMKKLNPLFLAVIAALPFVAVSISANYRSESGSEQASAIEPDAAALERTRKKVALLDNVYKHTINLIAVNYSYDEGDIPTCRSAANLFANTSKSGSHQVRLIDATGQSYGPKNAPEDDFEREGVKHLKAGGDTYEQVVRQDGKYQLRMLTPVPVVLMKCAKRHDVAAGEFSGAISYTVPIE
jgi:hypothetical protein